MKTDKNLAKTENGDMTNWQVSLKCYLHADVGQ